ncbi:MAG: ComEC/Rec2 family competence protein [Acidimicrobiia bacterium]
MSERTTAAVTEAVRTGPTLADLAPVSLAVAAWAGATRAAPVPPTLLVALGLTFAVVAWVGGRPRMQVVLAGLALAALTSLLGARSLAGLDPRTTGDVETTVALVTDPEPTPTGRVRAEVRLDGQRLMAEARAPAAIEALAPLLAGDRVLVGGVVEAYEHRSEWTVSRHLAGRLRVESVVAVGQAAPHASAANGLRRLLDRGASSLPDRHRSLLSGLTLGDDRAQPAELTADFRASGLTHLLAVSGQNLVLVLAVAGPVLRRLRIWPRFVVALGLVASFAFVTRFEPSVVRAAFVAGVALWATTSGRPSGGLRHLALAVAGLLVVDPLLTRSIGFRLSVAACLGVLLLSGPVVARLPGPRWAREALGLTIGAQLAVAPVLVPTFGAMPLAALPANVAAAPLAGALMVWGVTAGVVAGIAGGLVATILHLPSRIGLVALEQVAALSSALPLGHVDLRHVAAVALAAVLLTRARARPRAVGAMLLVTALLAPALDRVPSGSAPAGWAATVWSDGPAAIVDLEAGASGVEVLDVLRRRQVHVVALVIVRAPRPELATVVEAIRARLPVQTVLAPDGSTVADHAVPRPGLVAEVAGFEVQVVSTAPSLRVRIGRAGAEPAPGRR